VLELDLTLTAEEALAICLERGLAVTSERELAGSPGSKHWHLSRPGHAGTLELSERDSRASVKVHSRREGTWAPRLARELAARHPDEEPTLVERPAVEVMFTRAAADAQPEITRAWTELEDRVGSLRGRKFYGTFDPRTEEYRACVQVREGDDAGALGLELGTLPGGRFARVRLRGEPPDVYRMILPSFQALARRAVGDDTRPSLEFYRRHDVIELLLPVR